MTSAFGLWHGHLSDDGMICRFDVLPSDLFVQLGRGTRDLMQHFVATLDIEGQVETWTIQPFCSPYYADDAPAHWPRLPPGPFPFGGQDDHPAGAGGDSLTRSKDFVAAYWANALLR